MSVLFALFKICMSPLKKNTHGFSMPCNTWVGVILAKGRSDDLTAIFAVGHHITIAACCLLALSLLKDFNHTSLSFAWLEFPEDILYYLRLL